MDITKTFGLQFNRKINREWTQQYVPVIDIQDGVIIASDAKGKKHYVKMLEIIPINFPLLSAADQDGTIIRYATWLKTAPKNFQIHIETRLTDVEGYIAASRKAYDLEPNPKCKALISNYIDFLKNKGAFQTYEKKYFLIYEFEADHFGNKVTTEAEVIALLNNQAEQIKSDFHTIGNGVALVSDVGSTHKLDNDIAEILYGIFNKRTSMFEPFSSRVQRIAHDTMLVNNLSREEDLRSPNIKDLIAPKSIDFEESSDYMVIDGMYKAFYYIAGNSIPGHINTNGGWLQSVLNFGFGCDVDIYYQKGDATQKLLSIRQKSKFQRYQMMNAEPEQTDYEDIEESYTGTQIMKKALKKGGEDVYDMVVLITLSAFTREDLFTMQENLKKLATTLEIRIGECKRFQEEGFFSTLPLVQLSPKLYNLGHRNMTTSAVAAGYPFTAFALSDKSGIMVGFHKLNKSMVLYDPFDTSRYHNANLTIYGATGNGKTYLLLLLVMRLRYQGVQNFILAPEKQEEFRRVIDAVGGLFFEVSPSSSQRINIFDILPKTSPSAKALGGESYVEKSWLIDKVDNLKMWAKYLIPDLTRAETALIGNILIKMYEDFGITTDNNSVYADASHTKLKTPPIMQDFYDRVYKEYEAGNIRKDIPTIISEFTVGVAKNMNGYTNIDLDNKFIVFGLEYLKDSDLEAPMMFMILEYVWGKVREDRTKKKMISIDEGWKLLSGKDNQVGAFVMDIFKMIRGFGGGALFATQSLKDLFQNENNYGTAILDCAQSKFILGLEPKALKNISSELELSQNEYNQITRANRGEALFCAGHNHIPITIKASAIEHDLITTDRAEMEKIAERNMRKQGA